MSHLLWPILAGILVGGIVSTLVRHGEKAERRVRRDRMLHIDPAKTAGGVGVDAYYRSEQGQQPDSWRDLP